MKKILFIHFCIIFSLFISCYNKIENNNRNQITKREYLEILNMSYENLLELTSVSLVNEQYDVLILYSGRFLEMQRLILQDESILLDDNFILSIINKIWTNEAILILAEQNYTLKYNFDELLMFSGMWMLICGKLNIDPYKKSVDLQETDIKIIQINWLLDGNGYVQFSTNNFEYYEKAWYQFFENVNKLGIYKIECKKINGAKPYGYGMVFGASNNEPYSFFLLMINAEGYYCIQKKNNIESIYLKPWIKSDILYTGYDVVNTLEVIENESMFIVYLNGFQVYQFYDNTIMGKRLGYYASIGNKNEESFPNNPVDIRFKQK